MELFSRWENHQTAGDFPATFEYHRVNGAMGMLQARTFFMVISCHIHGDNDM